LPFNLPTYDTDKFSFGPCVIYAGPAGSTPTTCIGAVRGGASLEITREIIEVTQGNPALVVKRYVTNETGSFTVTGIEWDFDNFARALSGGTTTSTSFTFGGSVSLDDLALKVVHETPSGITYNIYLWRVNGAGTLTIPFSDEVHEFEYTFNLLIPWDNDLGAAIDWAGNTLSTGEQLFKIERIE